MRLFLFESDINWTELLQNKKINNLTVFSNFIFVPGGVESDRPSTLDNSMAWTVVLPSVSDTFNMRGAVVDSSLIFGALTFRILVTWSTRPGKELSF